jgi:hypothetical protein
MAAPMAQYAYLYSEVHSKLERKTIGYNNLRTEMGKKWRFWYIVVFLRLRK